MLSAPTRTMTSPRCSIDGEQVVDVDVLQLGPLHTSTFVVCVSARHACTGVPHQRSHRCTRRCRHRTEYPSISRVLTPAHTPTPSLHP
eukprot:5051437-Prymnesium_polylepis.1